MIIMERTMVEWVRLLDQQIKESEVQIHIISSPSHTFEY